MLIAGIRVCYRVAGQGTVHCQRCGGDRPYQRRSGRRWFHVLRVPVLPLTAAGDHLRCLICRTCYRVELLAVPTTARMQAALLTGTKAASIAMLRAGDPASAAARRRAVELIRNAGEPDFDAGSLSAALCPGQESDLMLGALALQLEMYAREWFLANVVRIGLADGPLSAGERLVVRSIAKSLGMTQAQAQDVIWLTEEAAQAG
jgi:tellurite resistance protein